jgi:GntR family transcriptional regulator
VVDFSTGRPAYLQVADTLRTRILDGVLQPGDRLPSEAALTAEFGVSRTVPRMALRVLKAEGLVDGHPGKGVFVRTRNPLRRISSNRYTPGPGPGPFTTDAGAQGRRATWDYQLAHEPAEQQTADRLAIPKGDEVIVARYLFASDGEPVQLSTSWEPCALVGRTAVEDPEAGEHAGNTIARMDSIGLRVVEVVEDVSARAPLPREVERLAIRPGVPVLTVQRTMWTTDRPVQTTDMVIPADRYLLTYRIPVHSSAQP